MKAREHTFQCHCGQLQGKLAAGAGLVHLACHCRDCQNYAQLLRNPGETLDDKGGTEVVTTLQQHISFTQGAEHLACLSLSGTGLLRWYASCCDTPIANTARDPRLSFAALLHTGLGASGAALEAKLGTRRVAVNPKHAWDRIAYSPLAALSSTVRIVAAVLRARLDGSWKRSPFFTPGSSDPVAEARLPGTAQTRLPKARTGT